MRLWRSNKPLAKPSICSYNLNIEIEYDPAKDRRNIAERGLSFEQVKDMDADSIRYFPDDRKEYKEARFRAFGLLAGRLHVFVFTPRRNAVRIISFRKCNSREIAWYEEEIAEF